MKRLGLLLLAGLAGVWSCEKAPPSAAPQIRVFAAASTSNAVSELAKSFEAHTGVRVTANFAASSTLAQQVKAGAAADVFISADEEWMDNLAAAGFVVDLTRVNLLSNDLVLVAPKDKPFTARMSRDFDFAASLPGVKRIAVGDPSHVPAGRYARQALEHLGWWRGVEGKLLSAQDVRAALRLVELGEADAGIVYSTDAASSAAVVVVGTFPVDSHKPIVYPVAAVKRAGNDSPAGGSGGAAADGSTESARRFIEYLRSQAAAAVFSRDGFRVPSGQ